MTGFYHPGGAPAFLISVATGGQRLYLFEFDLGNHDDWPLLRDAETNCWERPVLAGSSRPSVFRYDDDYWPEAGLQLAELWTAASDH